jgi:hypothetical protein
MKRDKYMGLDVYQATTVVAVIDAEGKMVLETIVPTAAAAIRRCFRSPQRINCTDGSHTFTTVRLKWWNYSFLPMKQNTRE